MVLCHFMNAYQVMGAVIEFVFALRGIGDAKKSSLCPLIYLAPADIPSQLPALTE